MDVILEERKCCYYYRFQSGLKKYMSSFKISYFLSLLAFLSECESLDTSAYTHTLNSSFPAALSKTYRTSSVPSCQSPAPLVL